MIQIKPFPIGSKRVFLSEPFNFLDLGESLDIATISTYVLGDRGIRRDGQ